MMDIVNKLTQILVERKNADKSISYTAELYSKGKEAILKKISEEIIEYALAVCEGDRNKIIYEAADVFYHIYVSLVNENILPEEIYKELSRRSGVSGIEEKKNRKKENK